MTDFGSRIATLRPTRVTSAGFGFAFALILGLVNVIVIYEVIELPPWTRSLPVLLVTDFILCFALVIGIWRYSNRYRAEFFERGLIWRSRAQSRIVPYDEIAEFTFRQTRIYTRGIYGGTRFQIEIGDSDPMSPRIQVDETIKEKSKPFSAFRREFLSDQPKDIVRNTISSAVVARMERVLSRGGAVPWVADVSIHSTGLELPPGQARSHQTRLPWSEVDRIEQDDGEIRLWAVGVGRPVITLSDVHTNFFPGLMLVERFLAAGRFR